MSQVLQEPTWEQSGDSYINKIIDLVKTIQPRIFVEIGVGAGHSILSAAQAWPQCSYYAVDLFRDQDNKHVDPMQEFLDNLQASGLRNVIPLKAPGEFPAQSFPENYADLVHLDVGEDEHTLRFLYTAWRTKAVRIVARDSLVARKIEGIDTID